MQNKTHLRNIQLSRRCELIISAADVSARQYDLWVIACAVCTVEYSFHWNVRSAKSKIIILNCMQNVNVLLAFSR